MVKEKKKYCPLSFFAPQDESSYCQKEKCEWWIVGIGGISIATCSIKVLAENLFFIQEYLKQGRK